MRMHADSHLFQRSCRWRFGGSCSAVRRCIANLPDVANGPSTPYFAQDACTAYDAVQPISASNLPLPLDQVGKQHLKRCRNGILTSNSCSAFDV